MLKKIRKTPKATSKASTRRKKLKVRIGKLFTYEIN